MTIAPLQAFGLGDIIFCQTLANDWIAEGNTVVWGVMPDWVEHLSRAYPNVQWVNYKDLPINYMRQDEHDSHGFRVVPLRWSVEHCKAQYKDCMKTKYGMFGRDWQDWRKGAMWQPHPNERILAERYNIYNEPYNLIHQDFGSDVQFKRTITVNNKLRNVYVEQLPGFSLFDWALVYQNATTIQAVSSSNIYLMEMLDLQATEIKLYKRDRVINLKNYTEPHEHYSYILQRHQYILE